jgi:hypothetical protein
MLVTLAGILIEVRAKQPENANIPILVTLPGIEMEARARQPSNALSPIAVTELPSTTAGMLTLADFPLYLVMVMPLPPSAMSKSLAGVWAKSAPLDRANNNASIANARIADIPIIFFLIISFLLRLMPAGKHP